MNKRLIRQVMNEKLAIHEVSKGSISNCNGCEICSDILKLRKMLEQQQSQEQFRYLILKNNRIIKKCKTKKELQQFLRVNTTQLNGNIDKKEVKGYKILYAIDYKLSLMIKKGEAVC